MTKLTVIVYYKETRLLFLTMENVRKNKMKNKNIFQLRIIEVLLYVFYNLCHITLLAFFNHVLPFSELKRIIQYEFQCFIYYRIPL